MATFDAGFMRILQSGSHNVLQQNLSGLQEAPTCVKRLSNSNGLACLVPCHQHARSQPA
jgi:hypothetical protein